MKAVLDEGVPRRLASLLVEHGSDVSVFPNHWKGLKNGMLLSQLVKSGFDCLLTTDKNLWHQQNIAKSGIAVIVLPFQRFEDLVPFAGQIVEAFRSTSRGTVTEIGVG